MIAPVAGANEEDYILKPAQWGEVIVPVMAMVVMMVKVGGVWWWSGGKSLG